ncbi:MAG: glycosyltransferase family 2 protein [Candidatus Nomurabacteria bacterium]|jgi:glycosyltransferase involved in cell wall biosynthesis|nr:glycosyltransferase family 2 protein [Candidatus Nomurabacteria bacterium]
MKQIATGISFVIPMYNSARYIERCLGSFRSDPRVEVIVVDDGSSDNSCQIVEDFIRSSNVNIRLIKNPHGGTSRTRQTGIRQAKFNYISFVDSDDTVIFDNMIKLFEAVVKHQVPLGIGRDALVLLNGARVSSRRRGNGVKDLSKNHRLLAENILMFHGKVFAKDLIRKCYTTDHSVHEDYQTMPMVFAAAGRWYNSNLRVYRTFQQPDSMIMTFLHVSNADALVKTVAAAVELSKTAQNMGLFQKYQPEFEAILILPFVELTANTHLSPKLHQKRKLYQIIVSILTIIVPNWRANRYYRRLFWGFEWNHRIYNLFFHFFVSRLEPIDDSLPNLIEKYKKLLK